MLYSTYISNIKNLTETQKGQVLNIARYFKSDLFPKDIRLCPSTDLLNTYKAGNLDWDEFVIEFKDQMSKGETLQGLRDLYKKCKTEDVILVCYEKDYNMCHRKLIGDFISSYGISYEELPSEESKTYKKSDLLDGMVVDISLGHRFLVLNGSITTKGGFYELDDFSEAMKHKNGFTIDAIYCPNTKDLGEIFDDEKLEIVWERKKK